MIRWSYKLGVFIVIVRHLMEEYIIFYKNMACMCSRNAHATGIGTCSTIGTCSLHLHMQPPMAYAAYTAHCTYATNVHIHLRLHVQLCVECHLNLPKTSTEAQNFPQIGHSSLQIKSQNSLLTSDQLSVYQISYC